MGTKPLDTAIIDFGMGNLFSVQRAAERGGLTAEITRSKEAIVAARSIILPGVGAFGDAMEILRSLDLVSVIQDAARSGKPLMGVCLGMQLLMSESCEFGNHTGLNIIEGRVRRLADALRYDERIKAPSIGWSRIHADGAPDGASIDAWKETPLESLPNGAFMYFVHSYYPEPADRSVGLSWTRYGSLKFCSSFRKGRIFGCQFHPERSGPDGLAIYRNFAAAVMASASKNSSS